MLNLEKAYILNAVGQAHVGHFVSRVDTRRKTLTEHCRTSPYYPLVFAENESSSRAGSAAKTAVTARVTGSWVWRNNANPSGYGIIRATACLEP